MHAGCYVLMLLFFTTEALPPTPPTFPKNLNNATYCRKCECVADSTGDFVFAGGVATSLLSPCTFPCVLLNAEGISSGIVVQWEPEGTPCKVGRCRGGSCLGFRNYAATKTLKSRMFLGDGISHRGIVADSDDRGINVPVLTSADISVKGPMSKISVTERSDEHNNNLDGRRTSATSVTSSNGGRVPDIGISRLRVKQVARRSDQQWPRSGTWRKKQKSKVCSGHLRKKERKCTRQATGVDSTNSQDSGGRNSSSSTSNDRRPPPSGAETGGGLTNLPSTTRFGGQDNFAGVAPGMANPAYGTGLAKRRRFSLPYGVAPMLTMSLVNSGIQIATEGVRAAIRHRAAKKAAAARRNAAAAAAGSRIGSSRNTEKAAGTAIPTSGRSNARASDSKPVTAGEDAGATGGEGHSVSISISVDTKPGNNTELGTSSGDHNGGTANTGNSSA